MGGFIRGRRRLTYIEVARHRASAETILHRFSARRHGHAAACRPAESHEKRLFGRRIRGDAAEMPVAVSLTDIVMSAGDFQRRLPFIAKCRQAMARHVCQPRRAS